jgi:GNAT superfamily N-acetyltransferase
MEPISLLRVDTKLSAAVDGVSEERFMEEIRGKQPGEDRLLNPRIDAAKIRAFFVHPAWARRGIGSQIMQKCEVAALEAGFKTIEIIATLAGKPLYIRFGYHLTQQFEIALPNESVLLVVRMVKNFAEPPSVS